MPRHVSESNQPPSHHAVRLTLSVEEAGRLLGIGRNAAYQAAREGQIPTIRIGRRYLVPRAALEKLLESAADVPGAA